MYETLGASQPRALALIDGYSKYPIVKVIASTAFTQVGPAPERIFAMFDLPEEIKMDNAPPFQGNEFQDMLRCLGIQHRRITPLWPQANGEVERFMHTLNKALRIVVLETTDPELSLYRFLREYRGTPHCTTGQTPWSLMLAGPRRDTIPTAPGWKPTPIYKLRGKKSMIR
ncbi:hypothetical protein NDU88_007906 [Pleurodeles waltl]|uniref:Integrase catalytic domain-containing protein n=1 Tax=Pleurodeles waltl TaxID=8319 RepID=A0AAV7PUT1_PLEWA|nr:hypothetical protein NDU88_007906 [Pleurodeles waltl]